MGAQLPHVEKEEPISFLKENIDVFAWNAYVALEIDPDFICHHLNVNPIDVSKRQPPWRSSKEHADAVKEEMNQLKQTEEIKESFYPEWLASIVVVKKSEK